MSAHVQGTVDVVYSLLNTGNSTARADGTAARKMLANEKAMLQNMNSLTAGLEQRPLPADVVDNAVRRIEQNEAGFVSERRPLAGALALHRWAQAITGCHVALQAEQEQGAAASAPVREEQRAASEMKGVSVHHLSTEFCCRLAAKGLVPDNVVYEVEPEVIRPEGAGRICPRDGKRGAAYVDCFDDADDVGAANRMLSYTWGYTIRDIVDTLQAHCQRTGSDPKKTYVWMCCVCINQHRVREMIAAGETVPFETFQREFQRRVEGIGHVVAMMAPWRAPVYISRVWCDFELYTATQEDVRVTIEMPPREAHDFLGALEQGTGLDEMWKVLDDLSVEKANASVKEDRDRILQLIRDGPGYHQFDSAVAKLLQTWIADVAERHIHNICCDDSVTDRSLTQSCLHVAELLLKGGRPARVIDITERCLSRLRSSQNLQPELNDYQSLLLSKLGHAKRQLGDTAGAEQAYVLQRALSSNHDGDACDLVDAGSAKMERGDFQGALQDFNRALELARSAGEQESVAAVAINIGNVKAKIGDLDGAIEAYKEASEISKERGKQNTPECANLMMNLANVHRMKGAWSDAVRSYEDARRIYEKTGTLHSPKGASLLANAAIAYGQSSNFQEALKFAQDAKAILEDFGMMGTPVGQQVLQIVEMASQLSQAPS